MQASLNIKASELAKFEATCNAALRRVDRGTKTATDAACQEIIAASLVEVPKDTTTLMTSAFYEVKRRTDTSANSWLYEAVIGYGGNGDPINPKTGKRASAYMLKVHEDIGTYHPTGKAKFLEDPVRQYAANQFWTTVLRNVQNALAPISGK